MKFQPKTEKEVAEAGLWSAGVYDFEVSDATDKVSNKGNDMAELKVRVFNAEGNFRTVFDYLVDTENSAFKIRNFAAATGMLPEYERGELKAMDMLGRTGKCKLIISKDKSGQYPDKNSIADYLKRADAVEGATGAPASFRRNDLDDEIPF